MIGSIRLMRTTGPVVVLLLALATIVAHPIAAQNSTPVSDQPVVVAGTAITWIGGWEYDQSDSYSVASVPEQAIFVKQDDDVNAEIGWVKVLTYGPLGEDSAASASEAVDVFAQLHVDGASPNAVAEVGTGELENSTAWALYTFTPSASSELQGQSVASLVTARENGEGGGYVVTSLTAPSYLLEETISQVQNGFTLDGDGQLLEGIDAAELAADLPETESPGAMQESTPVASPEITVLGSSDATPGASPADIPVVSPEATPLGDAEATLAAIQNVADEGTPAASLEPAPAG